MANIVSKVPNQNYRDNYEFIYGNKGKVEEKPTEVIEHLTVVSDPLPETCLDHTDKGNK